jgi:hypothetical protein
MAGDEDKLEAEILAAEAERLRREGEYTKEHGKYVAASWDRASTGLITIGVFTPMIGFLYRISNVVMLTALDLAFAVAVCLAGAFALHMFGRRALEKGLGT